MTQINWKVGDRVYRGVVIKREFGDVVIDMTGGVWMYESIKDLECKVRRQEIPNGKKDSSGTSGNKGSIKK